MTHDDSFDQRWLRSAIDLAICFVMAVIMLRAFVLEGYLISTGSMAPGLLGFHRHVRCPSCRFEFAFGVSFDDSVENGAGGIQEPEGFRRYATCPNCGQINIDVSGVPNSHGDQLLVQKHVYDLRPPRRWETVVFHNPASPGEAYVKRVVGLPGERIRIINGDVYINGQIARKEFAHQQWMRIPVCNLHFLAEQEDWQLPWELDDGWRADEGSLRLSETANKSNQDVANLDSGSLPGTEAADPDVADPATAASEASSMQWIRFRNWRWFGGHHVSETPLAAANGSKDWASFVARFDTLPISWTSRIDYDSEREVLRCEGVMPDDLQKDLLAQSESEEFQNAVYRLAALSHLAPVTDRYGYNALVTSPEYVVSDLLLKAVLEWKEAPSEIRVRVPVGMRTYELRMNPESLLAELVSEDDGRIVRSGRISLGATTHGAASLILEVSNFDQQVAVAVNGVECFSSLPVESDAVVNETLEASVSDASGRKMNPDKATQIMIRLEQQKRWALGVWQGDVRVTDLEMYRDVFYTPGRRKNAIESDYVVPEESYFVQGDNSPVSSDSRNWQNPCVPHPMLIGKPFLVHLPSRPAVLQFGGQEWPVRVPEWHRIRYIR